MRKFFGEFGGKREALRGIREREMQKIGKEKRRRGCREGGGVSGRWKEKRFSVEFILFHGQIGTLFGEKYIFMLTRWDEHIMMYGMESRYSKDKVSLEPLRNACRLRGMKMKEVAEAAGVSLANLHPDSGVGIRTQRLARVCAVLRCSVDEVLAFNGIKVKEMYRGEPRYTPPENPEGDVTYAPLRDLITTFYMWREDKKTIMDFFDTLPRTRFASDAERLARLSALSLAARGLEAKPDAEKRRAYDKGLPYQQRNRILHDRDASLAVIYDICDALGCTPGWVMSYK